MFYSLKPWSQSVKWMKYFFLYTCICSTDSVMCRRWHDSLYRSWQGVHTWAVSVWLSCRNNLWGSPCYMYQTSLNFLHLCPHFTTLVARGFLHSHLSHITASFVLYCIYFNIFCWIDAHIWSSFGQQALTCHKSVKIIHEPQEAHMARA